MQSMIDPNTTPSHKLETEPVGKLLWQYAVPAIIGTMVMSLYTVIDRIFIGQGVGPDAISGLALTFPIMNLTAAVGMLVGAGASARISIVLGQKDQARAEKILGNSLILTLILASSYILFFIFFNGIVFILFDFGLNTPVGGRVELQRFDLLLKGLEDDEQRRYEEQQRERSDNHTADDARTQRRVAVGSYAVRQHQR